jgi:hypothetical protein
MKSGNHRLCRIVHEFVVSFPMVRFVIIGETGFGGQRGEFVMFMLDWKGDVWIAEMDVTLPWGIESWIARRDDRAVLPTTMERQFMVLTCFAIVQNFLQINWTTREEVLWSLRPGRIGSTKPISGRKYSPIPE